MKFDLFTALKKLKSSNPVRTQWHYLRPVHSEKTFTFVSPFTGKQFTACWIVNQDLREIINAFIHNKWTEWSLGDPRVIVDLGSNNGYSSLYFKDRFPEADLYAIDLLQTNIMFSNRLFQLNHLPSRHISTAISNVDGFLEVDLHPSHARNRLSSLLDDAQRSEFGFSGKNIWVGAKRLKTFASDLGIAQIDLLKVDIEGAEQYLIEDIDNWHPFVQSIILEVHHNIDVEWCEQELRRVGYSVTKGSDDWFVTK